MNHIQLQDAKDSSTRLWKGLVKGTKQNVLQRMQQIHAHAPTGLPHTYTMH